MKHSNKKNKTLVTEQLDIYQTYI